MNLSHNARDILRKMEQRRDRVTAELTQAARVIGPVVSGEAKKILQQDVYNVPIPLKATADHGLEKVPQQLHAHLLAHGAFEKPLSPNAKVRNKTTKEKYGKWERTGALKRAETWTASGPVVVLRNNQAYAVARYTLGTSESSRKIKSEGVKSVQWQAEAIAKYREFILEERRKAVLKALGV